MKRYKAVGNHLPIKKRSPIIQHQGRCATKVYAVLYMLRSKNVNEFFLEDLKVLFCQERNVSRTLGSFLEGVSTSIIADDSPHEIQFLF